MLIFDTIHQQPPLSLYLQECKSTAIKRLLAVLWSLCLIGMLFLRKIIDENHIWICSVMGAVLHNIGQIIVAAAVMKTTSVISYLPFLLVSVCIAGEFTGMCAQILITKVQMMGDKND